MELAQLIGAFVGGGVFGGAAKTLFDYLSKDRLERRLAMRPRDLGRIDRVRELCHQLKPDQNHYSEYSYDSGLGSECGQLVFALADGELQRYWEKFYGHALLFKYHYHKAEYSERASLQDEIVRSYANLMRRLNELERKR